MHGAFSACRFSTALEGHSVALAKGTNAPIWSEPAQAKAQSRASAFVQRLGALGTALGTSVGFLALAIPEVATERRRRHAPTRLIETSGRALEPPRMEGPYVGARQSPSTRGRSAVAPSRSRSGPFTSWGRREEVDPPQKRSCIRIRRREGVHILRRPPSSFVIQVVDTSHGASPLRSFSLVSVLFLKPFIECRGLWPVRFGRRADNDLRPFNLDARNRQAALFHGLDHALDLCCCRRSLEHRKLPR